jgi:hypothetical protein
VVGAEGSSALTTTTWDFETGDLTGWRKTGTAFDYQPTFGDNSIMRSVYQGMEEDPAQSFESYGSGQASKLQGRYYVGTFEKHPGAGHEWTLKHNINNREAFHNGAYRAADYKEPGKFPEGTVQGDVPQGTLTSQPFVVLGTTIKFKVGGGCSVGADFVNDLVEHISGGTYVELIVDGVSREKTTGECSESMRWHSWDVQKFQGRTAQIRLVDRSSSNWGHINFDDCRFDWKVSPEVTPNAGAAYVYRRHRMNEPAPAHAWNKVVMPEKGSDEPCTGNSSWNPHPHLCGFELQAKLQASDKRANDRFGAALSVEDDTGLIAVGAANQRALNQYREPVKALNNTGEATIAEAGAVYIYKRQPEFRDGMGMLITPPQWGSYELARLQARDYDVRDHFGSSVSVSNFTLFAGASGDDGKGVEGGAVYQVCTSRQHFGKQNLPTYLRTYLPLPTYLPTCLLLLILRLAISQSGLTCPPASAPAYHPAPDGPGVHQDAVPAEGLSRAGGPRGPALRGQRHPGGGQLLPPHGQLGDLGHDGDGRRQGDVREVLHDPCDRPVRLVRRLHGVGGRPLLRGGHHGQELLRAVDGQRVLRARHEVLPGGAARARRGGAARGTVRGPRPHRRRRHARRPLLRKWH